MARPATKDRTSGTAQKAFQKPEVALPAGDGGTSDPFGFPLFNTRGFIARNRERILLGKRYAVDRGS